MRLQILGLNHTTAPVEVREQVVFAGDQIGRALVRLKEIDGVDEAVLLLTCNRTEFYVITSDDGRDALQAWLHNEGNLSAAFADTLFSLDEERAIHHIFRVACGLDSMVLGEPQILGQLKDAVRDAEQAGSLGKHLGALFQHTFSVAKKVRTETEIGASPVSVASAAVSLAQQFFAGFKHRHIAWWLKQLGHHLSLTGFCLARLRVGFCRAMLNSVVDYGPGPANGIPEQGAILI